MTHHTHTLEVKNPGPYRFSSTLKMVFGICALVGIASIVAGLATAPERAWPNFLLNYFYFLLLGLSGAFFVALQHITNAYWSVTVRRLAEGLTAYLPVAFVLGLVLLFGLHNLYEWTHHDVVVKDRILSQKMGYLNTTFFAIRLVGAFAIWILFTLLMRRNSLAQDSSGDHKFTLSNIKLSAVFLPLFGLSFTMMSFDLVMSLEPHWFSTIFGIYCFSGLFFSGLSLLSLLVIYGRKQGVFANNLVNENHLHDIGKLMFGFTVFWAYIGFSQLMLQWYANLPEETSYYIRRFHGGWWPFSIFLFVIHFVVPFFGLLPREAKRCESYLKAMAVLMLVAQWFDAYYLVMPVFFKEGPVFGWIEVGTFLGFLGVFAITVGRFLEKVPAVPVKDPRLVQCVAHSQ
ncbi:MAG: hypothetical protein AB1540_01130 [Bdellovibrionota bacterium]